MEMGIILLVVVLLGAWLAMRSKRWKTLLTDMGPNAEQLRVKYEHLKSNNIKCKLVTDASPVAGSGIMQAPDVMPNRGVETVIQLKVHHKHVEQAKELLEEFPEAV